MHLDVLELRAFYATPLGSVARRVIAGHIRRLWGRVPGETIVGIGYAPPYIGGYRAEAARIVALMPAAQGALVWPLATTVNAVMVEEQSLPLPDNSIDRIVVVHCLELSEHARPMMRELWRVLAPEGRLLLVVPNRHSVWSRREATPFGHGQPYSRSQLQKLLAESMFTPVSWSSALHVPPVNRAFAIRRAGFLERLGSRYWPGLAGVHIVEATKEVHGVIPAGAGARRIGRLATADGSVNRTSPAKAPSTGDLRPRQ
ncbi:MAG TPA: methyltransferase domain-containing protein [Hyphomicrobiaceae bacterium]|nr:methyltransferase domain-containing protein [Hyphomicrobiaceae bacterium]